MTLAQLRSFVLAARLGSVTIAAAELDPTTGAGPFFARAN
jgi:DNA-binding transcriptional LysR family regulator